MLKNLPANARDEGDLGSIPGLGSSPGGGNGNLLQYSCLENSMDRGGWQATSPWSYKELNTTQHACTICNGSSSNSTPSCIPKKELKIGTQNRYICICVQSSIAIARVATTQMSIN